MKAETPAGTFEVYRKKADDAWEKALARVKIETTNKADKTVFYTALYHMYFGPSLFNDVNNDYLGTNKEAYRNVTFKNYTTFSLSDIYRGWSPFMTILRPDLVKDQVKSMLAIHQQQGRLPVWPLVGSETDCMIGNPAVIIL